MFRDDSSMDLTNASRSKGVGIDVIKDIVQVFHNSQLALKGLYQKLSDVFHRPRRERILYGGKEFHIFHRYKVGTT